MLPSPDYPGPSWAAAVRAARRVAVSSAGEIIGRAVNVVIPFAVLGRLTATDVTDRFFLALAVAFFVYGTIGNAVVAVQVPFMIRDDHRYSLSRFLRSTFVVSLAAGVAAWALSAPSTNQSFAAITGLAVAVAGGAGLISAPAVAVLSAGHRYLAPGMTWGLRAVPVIVFFRASPDSESLKWLLAGIAAADACRAAVLLTLARRRLTLGHRSQSLEFPADAVLLVAGSVVAGLTPLVARLVAAAGGPGDVSIYETADRLYIAMASLATIGMSNVILVYLARLEVEGGMAGAWVWILRSATLWSFLWLLVAGAAWAAFPALSVFFLPQSGETIALVRNVFMTLSLGLPAYVMTVVFSKRLLTLRQVRFLVGVAFTGLACSAVSCWIFSHTIGLVGVALGILAGHYVTLFLLATRVRRLGRAAHPCLG